MRGTEPAPSPVPAPGGDAAFRAAPEGLAARLVRGVSWNLAGAVFNQGSTFAVNIVLANAWGAQLFGRYAIVQSTVATVVHVAQLAMGYTATRYLAQYRVSDRARASRLLGLCGGTAVAVGAAACATLLALSPIVAERVLGDAALGTVLAIGALVVFPGVMNGFMSGALAGLEGYPALGRVLVVAGVGYAVAGCAGGWLFGLPGAVAGVVASAVLQALLLRSALVAEAHRHGLEFRFSGAAQERHALVRFAIPAALNGFLYLPAVWITNAMLAAHGTGFDQVALFSAANSFRMIALFVPAITNNVGMSLLNNQRGHGDETRFRRVFWLNVLLTVGAVGLAALAMAVGRGVLLGFFGPEFAAGRTVLLVLVAAAVPEAITLAVLHPVQNQDRVWLVFGAVILPCYLTLVLAAQAWIPVYGAVGLAWAYAAGWTLALASSLVVVARLGIWRAQP